MDTVITRKELGKRLRKAREAADLKATPVAAGIGCHPDTIANYESGTTEPSFRAVCIYSILTGQPLDSFLPVIEEAVA